MTERATRMKATLREWDDFDPDLKRDQVYEQILLDIVCGELRPGERVDELGLAERYDVGRAGVRDALSRLSFEGLIERRPRLGSVVVGIHLIELQQVFHLRVQLEGQCAAMAARNARKQDIVALCEAFADAESIIKRGDWRALVKCDRNFHHALANAAQNRWLANVVVMLHTNALRFWHYSLPRRPVQALYKEIAYHRAVAAAVDKRDPDGAQKSMKALLGEFPATVQDLFSAALTDSK
jgi:DNA-binding GntR family transcriptional regulator